MEEAKNDPVKKAATIKDIVESISKIPDAIQREVYVQSCASIMEISEEVLFSAWHRKEFHRRKKSGKGAIKTSMQLVPPTTVTPNVDALYELEKQIITLLMLYGHREERFQESVLEFSEEENEVEEKTHEVKAKVFEKIFLDLQQDEIELANPNFKALYHVLLEQFQNQRRNLIRANNALY